MYKTPTRILGHWANWRCSPAVLSLGLGIVITTGQAGAQAQPAAEPVQIVAAEKVQATAEDKPSDESGDTVQTAEQNAEAAMEMEIAVAHETPELLKMRRYVRVNSALARRVCDLSQSEEKALALMTDAWIAAQIRESVELPGAGAMVGILRFLSGAAVDARPQEVKLPAVQKRIDGAIADALTPENRQVLQREQDARGRFRKRALAAVLVSALDKRLYLSPEQRTTLETDIADWLTIDLYWELYFQNSNYVPDIPRQILSKALSPEQMAVVQGMQKFNYDRAQVEDQMNQEMVLIER